MTSDDVAARAISELRRRDDVDKDVAELATAELLTRDEIDAAVSRIIETADNDVAETLFLRQWLLARLMVLEQTELSAEDLLDRLEETYAEFGFPEELRRLSRYNVEPPEREASVGERLESPVTALSGVVQALRREVVHDA